MNKLFLVVDLSVELVVVADQVIAHERHNRLSILWLLLLDLCVNLLPPLVHCLPLVVVLLHGEYLPLGRVHLQCLVEGEGVDLLQDGLESDERLLEDLVPVVLSQVDNDGHEHGESLLLVSLKDVQEVVILKEAHGSVSDLEVDSSDALHDPLEQLWDLVLDLVRLADLEDLLQLGEEQGLLDAVREGPVLQESVQEWDGQCPIFG